MTTVLKQVLEAFQTQTGPLSLNELARDLDVDPGVLEGMLQYWVRKGRLREHQNGTATCTACSRATDCPFIVPLPPRYELVRDDEPEYPAQPPCQRCCT